MSSCLDHVLVKSLRLASGLRPVVSCCLNDVHFSDHLAIKIDFKFGQFASLVSKDDLKYKRLNYDTFAGLVEEVDWPVLVENENINIGADLFVSKFCECVHRAMEVRCIPRHPKKRRPWASLELMNASKEKNDLYKLLKKYPRNLIFKSNF